MKFADKLRNTPPPDKDAELKEHMKKLDTHIQKIVEDFRRMCEVQAKNGHKSYSSREPSGFYKNSSIKNAYSYTINSLKRILMDDGFTSVEIREVVTYPKIVKEFLFAVPYIGEDRSNPKYYLEIVACW